MGGIAMVDGIATTGGLATADGLQTAGGQYILTGPQSILATEEPAMLVTVLAVRRRRSRQRSARAAALAARHGGATALAVLTAEPRSQPCDGPADIADGRSLSLSLTTDRRTRRTDGEEELAMKRKEGSQRAFHVDSNVLETPLTRVVGMKRFPSFSCLFHAKTTYLLTCHLI
jgi:hypothetical protein